MKMHAKAFLIVVTLLLVSGWTRAKEIPKHVTSVTDGVYSYGDSTKGYTSMFVVTNEGVIVIEPINSKHAKGMLSAIKKITNQPIKIVIHSHNHWDHSGGGKVFKDIGADILAHREAVEWMKANPHRDLTLPNKSWSGNRKDVTLGGKTIELHYLGMNHGLGMTVFLLPKEKIIYIADLVTPKRLLFTIVPDFNIKETQRTLTEILNLRFETAIFSHGQKGGKKEIREIWQYTEDLKAEIGAELKKGTSLFSIPNSLKLPKYKKWAMYKEWLPLNTWRILLDMHMGPFPWHK